MNNKVALSRKPLRAGRTDLMFMAILAGASLAGGCFSFGTHHKSEELLEKEEYDQAVVELRKVVAEDRTNNRHQIALAEAESKAADAHIARAKKFRTDHRPADARTELKKALDMIPVHPEAIHLLREVDKELADSKGLAQQARQAMADGNRADAARLAEEALALDGTLTEMATLRDEARAEGVAFHLKRSREALEAERWEEARTEVGRLKTLAPDHAEVATLEKTVDQREKASALANQARKNTEVQAALDQYDQAIALWPDNKKFAKERADLERNTLAKYIERADAQFEAGRFAAGIGALDAGLKALPDHPTLIQRHKEMRAKWNESLLDGYERQALNGRWELTWPLAIEAAVAGITRETATQNLIRSETMIHQRLACRICVLPARLEGVDPTDGAVLLNAVVQSLDEAKSDHIRLVGPTDKTEAEACREALSVYLDGPDAWADVRNKLPEADVYLLLLATAQEVEGRRELNPGTSQYLVDKADQPGQGVVWQVHRYPIERIERRFEIRISINARDAGTGKVFWQAEDTVGKAGDADTLVEADPAHNVPAKKARVRSMDQLRAAAFEEVLPTLRNKSVELLTQRSLAYLEAAQNSQGPESAENYIRFLFDCVNSPGENVLDLALQEIFAPQVSPDRLAACKTLAGERLSKQYRPIIAVSQPASAPAQPGTPTPSRSELIVQEAPAAEPAAPPAPVSAAPSEPAALAEPSPAEPASPEPRLADGRPQRVFTGIVSRDDDRYPKERRTTDAITVKVEDTDPSPLDADLEIRVGSKTRNYRNIRPGTVIRLQGLSGQSYKLTILAIDDRNESVKFALDQIPSP